MLRRADRGPSAGTTITDRHRAFTTIHGTGYDSDLLIVSEIGDIRRLPNAKKQCSCAGIVLFVRSSDDKARHGSITKLGSKWLRWILIELSRRFAKSCSRLERMCTGG